MDASKAKLDVFRCKVSSGGRSGAEDFGIRLRENITSHCSLYGAYGAILIDET